MSRKSKRNQPNPVRQEPPAPSAPPASRLNRKALFIGSAIALVLAFLVGTLVYKSEKVQVSQQAAAGNPAALERFGSPTAGKADAKVHIVEFFDPACETCAVFYPHVKGIMAANPDRIRLSVRHVPFHRGSDQVVRMLEAARNQGKYWETLEAVLASQDRWVINHVAQVEGVWPAIRSVGLDLDRLRTEMNAPEIGRRIEQDLADAQALGVTKTPEFFVNGRPMPRFGLEELQGLVREELRKSYP